MRTLLVLAILLLVPLATADHPGSNAGLAGLGPLGIENVVHNVFTVDALFDEWEAAYPGFVERVEIGVTEGGLPLHGIIITDESVPFDAPPHTASTKFRVYLDGGHHGNEYLGVEILMVYLEELLSRAAAGDMATLERLAVLEVHAVPIINVEGNLRDTRANLNLVDPNRNYDFGHTACMIPSLTCGGPAPFSESEIRANADYVLATSPDLWISMHTGIETLYYPAGEPFIPAAPDHALFLAMEGPFENATNGRIDMMGGPAPAVGSADDWGYAVAGLTTFTYEVHDDQFAPLYGEPISGLLASQLEGLRFLIDGTELWGAHVTLDPSLGIARNAGWGMARNVTVHTNDQTFVIPMIEAQSTIELPFQLGGETTWEYATLHVDASRTRHHALTIEPLNPVDGDRAAPGTALGLLVCALAAIASRRR